jgi:cytochrome c oxidase subunit 2
VRRRLIAAGGVTAGLVLLSACGSEDLPRLGLPTPASEQADRVLNLWQGSWFAALIVGGIVWGLIIWSSVFHRRKKGDDSLPVQTRYNLPIEILYTVTPLIVVSVLFYFTWRDENEQLERTDNPDVRIQVVAKQWSWDFNYLDDNVHVEGITGEPPTLVLPQNETVEFILTSPDVIHSFWVPDFLFKMDVFPADPNVIQIKPTRLGTFAGRCAEFCGLDHARMLFDVKVVTADEYQQFLDGLESDGLTGFIREDLMEPPAGSTDSDRVEPGEIR